MLVSQRQYVYRNILFAVKLTTACIFFLGDHRDVTLVLTPRSRVRPRRSSASARSRLGVGTPRPRLGLKLGRPWSRFRLGFNASVSTSVWGFKVSVSPRSRWKRPRAHPWETNIFNYGIFCRMCIYMYYCKRNKCYERRFLWKRLYQTIILYNNLFNYCVRKFFF